MKKKVILPKHKFHIKTGDTVLVIGGNSKGQRGVVKEVIVEKDRARIEGVAMITKHIKPTASNPQGSLVKTEGSVHISNLMLIDPATGEPTRTGRKVNEKGKLQRVSKKTGNFIPDPAIR
ncbi:50S ribosomal protein L24 [Spirosoma montaniterrae]|uniref:Large ribosomal subunit protein uL24 n=1 Tax=Spirosoma montaniterrae TaxID=1178516 RepID=A0A1P9X304_9BACT|nr:50S ribosomal protein L24 [Spirosoma montaniterrae]AQG82012.1 50S ribosomal protein L24 [Spirosoma montaniterrae]